MMKGHINMEKKSSKKNFIITTLLLGFLQTLLWESVISPLCNKIFSFASKLFSYIQSSYLDNLYATISLGHQNQYSHFVCLCVCCILFLFIMLNICNIIYEQRETPGFSFINKLTILRIEQIENYPKWLLILEPLILLLVLYLALFFNIGKNAYITRTVSTSLANIEIVSPYVTDTEYKTLKSEFYSMDSKEDYDTFCSHLEEISTVHNIDLKE